MSIVLYCKKFYFNSFLFFNISLQYHHQDIHSVLCSREKVINDCSQLNSEMNSQVDEVDSQNNAKSTVKFTVFDRNNSIDRKFYEKYKKAYNLFENKFLNNQFGKVCSVCDRLWFENDLKSPNEKHEEPLEKIVYTLKKFILNFTILSRT